MESKDPMSALIDLMNLQQEIFSSVLEANRLKNSNNIPDAIVAHEHLNEKSFLHRKLVDRHHELDPASILTWSPAVLLNSMTTLADLYESQGNFDRSKELWRQIEEVAASLDDEPTAKEMQRLLAVSLQGQGRFNEALTKFTDCHDYFTQRKDHIRLADVKSNLAEINRWLGDFDESERLVKEAFALLDTASESKTPGGNPNSLVRESEVKKIRSSLLQSHAFIRRASGDYDAAAEAFQKVKSLALTQSIPQIDFQLAVIYILAGQLVDGLELLRNVEPHFEGMARMRLFALWSWKAEGLLLQGLPGEALKYIEASVQDFHTASDPDSAWRVYWRKARIHLALKQPAEALAACAKSIEIIDGLRNASLGYRFDNLYLKDKIEVLEKGVELAWALGDVSLCCQFTEVVKSRSLTTVLRTDQRAREDISSDFERRFWSVTKRLDQLEFSTSLDLPGVERERLIAERETLIERIRFSDKRWHSLSAAAPFDLKILQTTLEQRDQSIISLFLAGNTIYSILITGKQCQVDKLSLSLGISQELERYQENLSAEDYSVDLFDPSAALGISADELIPRKQLDVALKSASLIVVPHRLLHLLPWAGMLLDDKRLFEHCPVGIVPNVRCITNLSFEPPATSKVAMIGAPRYPTNLGFSALDESLVEIEILAGAYGENVIDTPRIEREATVANFWKLAHHPDSSGHIFHLAMHGTADRDNPFNAALVLSDGKVDTARLMLAKMKYGEAVLSACSTGYRSSKVGKVELLGDDILSLPGSLLEGGVRSVLVSIPPAKDDVTRIFVILYHDYRARGKSPLRALQATQLAMLKKNEFPPSLWIGFTLYGVN